MAAMGLRLSKADSFMRSIDNNNNNNHTYDVNTATNNRLSYKL